MTELAELVQALRGSPILAVRQMAARALVPLISQGDVMSVISAIISTIPAQPPCGTTQQLRNTSETGHSDCHQAQFKFNNIHGSLLQIHQLIVSHALR